MSEKESMQNIPANDTEDLDTLLQNFDKTCGEGLPSPEKLAEMARKAPEPLAIGNEHVEILSHKILPKSGEESPGKGVYLEIKNIASVAIGKLALVAVLFDTKGYIIDTIEKTVADFEAGKTRILRIVTPAEKADVKSYEVKITYTAATPAPIAMGDGRIVILNHNFHDNIDADTEEFKREIEIAIRNTSPETVAITIFNAEIFDAEGNSLGEVRHIESDIKPGISRAVIIQIDSILRYNSARSYKVSIFKTITADTQKVLLRRDERKTLPNGDINISGIIKNVHACKTDASVAVTFRDAKKEELGTMVLPVKDIEPGTIKNFSIIFHPPTGESVKTYTVDVGEMAEVTG
ncbi:MAG: FxLYD domain-containing protein [Dehalococcoidales bacterium]|nr:FxLYD domain-containing protein [Dehalococcoidales bacterium]